MAAKNFFSYNRILHRYVLAFYQLQIVDTVCDTFFGDGTEKALTFKLFQQFPIPDALLRAFSYLLDVVNGIFGGIDSGKQNHGFCPACDYK
jgi:hypothetical protein